MKILCACEESQAVTSELRRLGHEAYSCDLLPTSGTHPDWHIQADALEIVKMDWDMVIAFPPCTYLAITAGAWAEENKRNGNQQRGIGFFLAFTALDHVPMVAIENPIGIMSTIYRKPDQIIQPWMFGHPESKSTCLWLKGLPKLVPTNDVSETMESLTKSERNRVHYMKETPDRGMLRSKTYQGIARAMAEQWAGDNGGISLGRPPTDDLKRRMELHDVALALRDDGESTKAIAAKMGVTSKTIRLWVKEAERRRDTDDE